MDETLLKAHIAYMIWADRTVLNALQGLAAPSPAMLSTLQHMYRAETIWVARLEGDSDTKMADIQVAEDLPKLRADWESLHGRWEKLASGGIDWSAICTHVTSQGVRYDFSRDRVLLHVVNHSTMHRGQVVAMIRAEGVAPPNTDLINYYRRHRDGELSLG